MSDFIPEIIASKKALFWDKATVDPEKDKFLIVERILDFFTPHDLDSLQWYKGLQTAFSGAFKLSAGKLEKNTLVAPSTQQDSVFLSTPMNSWKHLFQTTPCRHR